MSLSPQVLAEVPAVSMTLQDLLIEPTTAIVPPLTATDPNKTFRNIPGRF